MSELSCHRNYDIGHEGSITLVLKYNVGLVTKYNVEYNVGHEVQRWSQSTTLVLKLAQASTGVVHFLSEETVNRKQHDPQRAASLIDFIYQETRLSATHHGH